MLSILPAFILRALTRRAFRFSRRIARAAVLAERRELAEGGYYVPAGAAGAFLVVGMVLTALVEGM